MAIIGKKIIDIVDKHIAIEPFERDNCRGGGYDLSVGYWVLGEPDHNGKFKVVSQGHTDVESHPVIEIPSQGCLAVLTKEYICLGDRYCATIHARARLSIRGLVLNSTTVDPNWSGRQTYLIRNFTLNSVEFSPSRPFATMMIHEICECKCPDPDYTEDNIAEPIARWGLSDQQMSEIDKYISKESSQPKLSTMWTERRKRFLKSRDKVRRRNRVFRAFRSKAWIKWWLVFSSISILTWNKDNTIGAIDAIVEPATHALPSLLNMGYLDNFVNVFANYASVLSLLISVSVVSYNVVVHARKGEVG